MSREWFRELFERAIRRGVFPINETEKYTFEYDDQGRVTRVMLHANGEESVYAKRSYKETEDGLTEIECLRTIKGIEGPYFRREYSKKSYKEFVDKNGLLVRRECGDEIIKYTYNSDKKLVEENYSNGFVVKYEYNDQGKILKEIYCEPGEEPFPFWTYIYNEAGQLIEQDRASRRDHNDIYTKILYKYDSAGRCIEKSNTHKLNTTEYDYSGYGELVHEFYSSGDDGYESESGYHYDIGDVMDQYIVLDQNGALHVMFEYEDGRLVERVESFESAGDVDLLCEDENDPKYEYYDDYPPKDEDVMAEMEEESEYKEYEEFNEDAYFEAKNLLEGAIWDIMDPDEDDPDDFMASEFVDAYNIVLNAPGPAGAYTGFALVQMIKEEDERLLLLGHCKLYGLGTETGTIESYSDALYYFLIEHTDHIAWRHFGDFLDNSTLEDLHDKILKLDCSGNPKDEFLKYSCLARMYAEGLGCDASLETALNYISKANSVATEDAKQGFPIKYAERYTDILSEYIGGKQVKYLKDSPKLEAGDFVYAGKYNHRSILWKVLDASENVALLITAEALEGSYTSIRQNFGYYPDAHWGGLDCYYEVLDSLAAEDINYIEMDCSEEENRFNLQGALFLLNPAEVIKYLPEEERFCYWRQQAQRNTSDNESSDPELTGWWLSGIRDDMHQFISEDGEIMLTDNWHWDLGLRPALWVEIK